MKELANFRMSRLSFGGRRVKVLEREDGSRRYRGTEGLVSFCFTCDELFLSAFIHVHSGDAIHDASLC
jgi:hypothetical protein